MSLICDIGPILSPYVAAFWTSHSDGNSIYSRQILPDGKAGLVIRYSDGGVGPRVFLGGQATKSSEYEMHPQQSFFGVHFLPMGAFNFFGVPQGELTDKSVDLKDWDKAWASELEERVAVAKSSYEQSLIVRELLERKLIDKKPCVTIHALVLKIKTSEGQFFSAELEHMTGLSERKIQRMFYTKVGLSPRQLSGIFRFRKTLDIIREAPHLPLVDVAQNAGYFDQSHFIREFKVLAGTTPKSYHRGIRALNDWKGMNV